MLTITALSHSYDGSSWISYPDWVVSKGDHSMILGNSGSGKTTLLHLIGALISPLKGDITLENDQLSKMKSSALDHFRGRNIGIIFQKPHLIRSLTVQENIALAQKLGGKASNLKRVKEIMDQLSIIDLKNRKVFQLSEGQSQRVSVARAIVNSPKLLLADEPTASLDDENCERVIKLLKSQAEISESTLVIATHDQRVKSEFQNTLQL